VTDFQNWLRDRYGTPAALSGAWRRVISSFAEAAPPGEFVASRKEDLPPYLDWLAFQHARGAADAQGDALDYLWPSAPSAQMPPRMVYERVRLAARQLGPDGRPPTVAQAVTRVVPKADASRREWAARTAISLMRPVSVHKPNCPSRM